MNILYAYPTLQAPCGGAKQARLTVSLLNKLGHNAMLLRDKRYWSDPASEDDAHFYGLDSPVAKFPFELAGDHLTSDDVVLLPEFQLHADLSLAATWSARIAVNSQNGFATVRARPLRRSLLQRIEFAISNAPYVTYICHHSLRLPWERIFLVPHWMVRTPFVPQAPHPEASLSVAFMPRKIPEITRRIREQVERLESDVPWVSIHNRTESQVVELMRSSRVFFAAHQLEGCPMPALEAMACGAIVAGFPGTRGLPHPYATSLNGFWAPDDSVADGVLAVRSAIAVARDGGREYQTRIAAGHETLQGFGESAVMDALGTAMRAVQSRCYPPRPNNVVGVGIRGRLEFLSRQYSRVWLRTRAGQVKHWLKGERERLRPDLR